MFEMILDNYRKATESTMKLQQEMLRNWTTQWPHMFGLPSSGTPFAGGSMPGSEWLEKFSAAQK